MALAVIGLLLIMCAVSIAAWTATVLNKRGASGRAAWRRLPYSATLWMGIVLVVAAFSPTAAGALMVLLMAVVGTFFAVLLIRGVRRLSEFWWRLREIGNPKAWQGGGPFL